MGCNPCLVPTTSLSSYCSGAARWDHRCPFFAHKPLLIAPLSNLYKSTRLLRVVFVDCYMSGERDSAHIVSPEDLPSAVLNSSSVPFDVAQSSASSAAEAGERISKRELRRRSERTTYLFAAVASTVGITFLAAGAVYYRFAWQTQSCEASYLEMFATFSLAFGASIGMEFWARWAHQALWHDSLWSMHESHHQPREGPFELNDVFAIINALPAIALMAYGFFHSGLLPGLSFGAGLGITVFGIAYMFVHDGLVHRRFPVGPLANVPYFQKVAAAHQLHHADKFKGVPFGLFLGPQELESLDGGAEELERMVQIRKKLQTVNSRENSL
ncbi:hypothetical protein KP509_36G057300 [Ceratopteris richardii]|uniref:beta-carotene 3-hydroxylase n=1 Tax=Ceratopteris richardii TaxID=49495 RepID=A0A8T2QC95_CERRI|nr:hypothetical protein KP509_36G057300 [Ceratopteris richardii]